MPFPISASPRTKSSGSLDADSWTQAALTILARNGVEAVRVERLAKMLGVTKGSFYWHFKDRPALLDEMLRSWRQRATLGIIDRLEQSNVPPAERLKEMLKMMRNSPRAARKSTVCASATSNRWSKPRTTAGRTRRRAPR